MILAKLLFEAFLILRRIQRDIIMNLHISAYKVSVVLAVF